MMRNSEQTIGNLIDRATFNTVNYIDEDGYPVSRAMLAPRERNGIKEFWFSTNTSSNKVQKFRDNPQASIYFVEKRFFRAVCLVGTMGILETPEAKAKAWREGDTMYYREGVTDPDYCVLKFTALKGRYYSNLGSEDFDV